MSGTVKCPRCKAQLRPAAAPASSGDFSAVCPSCNYELVLRAEPVRTPIKIAPASISFTINRRQVTLKDVDPLMTLNEWIREQPGLTGTKRSCGEGGCGACVVAMVVTNLDGSKETISVNSCLRPLCSVDGCDIVTVEGIGNTRTGLHPIQQQICSHNGTQCGFCTPGFVMNMYALLEQNPHPTAKQIEDLTFFRCNYSSVVSAQDGNLCRCTGYRPILDAFETFAAPSATQVHASCSSTCSDHTENHNRSHTNGCSRDIEDLMQCSKLSARANQLPSPSGERANRPLNTVTKMSGPVFSWYQPETLAQTLSLLSMFAPNTRLVVGNTSTGIFKNPPQTNLINIKHIPDLNVINFDAINGLTVGSAVSITHLIRELRKNATSSRSYSVIADHIEYRVANTPVRNVACWAGNLMLTHSNKDFPSDLFVLFDAAGAVLQVSFASGASRMYKLQDFLLQDMSQGVIISVTIPPLQPLDQYQSYKVMMRHVNSHAYVNAAFRLQTDGGAALKVVALPSLVFGGIGPYTIHCPQTETYLLGKSLVDKVTLASALTILSSEIKPDQAPGAGSPEFRASVALSLFYKFYLQLLGNVADPRVRSAAVPYVRPVSTGEQSYDSDPLEYPVSAPLQKLEAPQQVTGEAIFTADISDRGGQLFGAPVLCTVAPATLGTIDTSAALKLAGVVGFFSAKDIIGDNNFGLEVPEEIFASSSLLFVGQCVGLIVAETQTIADRAAQLVTISYSNVKPGILTLEEAIAQKSFFPNKNPPIVMGDVDKGFAGASRIISGQISEGSQYHFHMETQVCSVYPEENGGLHIDISSQLGVSIQGTVSAVTKIPANKISVVTKRLGGAYGGKITRPNFLAGALATASLKLNRPVRSVMTLESNMKFVGKRHPFLCNYKVGVDSTGKLVAVQLDYYADAGSSQNDTDGSVSMAMTACDNAYYAPNWKVTGTMCFTNTQSNTATRAPGCVPAIFFMETIMEHLAQELNVNPQQFRQQNLYAQGQMTPYAVPLTYCSINSLWTTQLQSADFATRVAAVNAYNAANRWRKRGITAMPLKYGLGWGGYNTGSLVTVYPDGTLAINHTGVECGQGINTKIAQVAAYILQCDMSDISVRATNSDVIPNGQGTGGSITSELNSMAVSHACQQLVERFAPVRAKIPSPTWKTVVAAAAAQGFDLSARGYIDPTTPYSFAYSSYGVCVSEVEIDVLTGEIEVTRVDMLFDCGQSLNPAVDLGQVQGGFIMGLGHYLTEEIKRQDDGTLITDGTWEYKVPSAKDIPIDFRVDFLKNAPNLSGFLRSKASGEPPVCFSGSIFYAAKRAIAAARAEASSTSFFPLNAPATVEAIQQACLVNTGQFTF